tara:strand:+ start:643 stop:1320 length:678 start_codon:yes stop_codon:yes gene_type:complete
MTNKKATPKFSKASKMPSRSWSLEALDTCPGSIDPQTKDLVTACKGCYATTGNYRFPNVKAPRIHNKEDWKLETWVPVMVAELDNDRYFRWFDSGDVYDHRLAAKILEVMKLTPHCNHWLPTRMHKFPKFKKILQKMKKLPNVSVRYSSDSIEGKALKIHGSTIAHADKLENQKGTICSAYINDGKCGTCRACWSKDVALIVYPQHGKKMEKVNRESLIQLTQVA